MHICTYLCIYLWSFVAVSFYESCQWPSPSKYSRTVQDPCSCMRAGSRDLLLMDRLQRKAHSLDNNTWFSSSLVFSYLSCLTDSFHTVNCPLERAMCQGTEGVRKWILSMTVTEPERWFFPASKPAKSVEPLTEITALAVTLIAVF